MYVEPGCEEYEQSQHYITIITIWFSLVLSAGTALLLTTVIMALLTRRRMNQRRPSVSDGSVGEASETGMEVDCSIYEVVPQEVEKRRKTSSHLEDIAEDEESEGGEGEQGRKGSNYSVSRFSNESKTVSTSSLISGGSGYSRSSSDTQAHNLSSRHSLAVPGKSNLKRTESQTRADYVLKVRGRGEGDITREFLF